MRNIVGRHIPSVPDTDYFDGKRIFNELFLAAWTVRVGPLCSNSAISSTMMKKNGDFVSNAEVKQMNEILASIQSRAPSLAELYKELGVRRGATGAELKRAYMTQALACHPDRNRNDTNATERFQRLGEVYDVLRSTERQREYQRGPPVIVPGCPHPEAWLEKEFGCANALEPLVGALLFARPVDNSETSPRDPGDAAFRCQHNTRVELLRLRLEAELCVWMAGDHDEVLERAQKRANSVANTLGGARLLLATGRAYVDKADIALGKRAIFALPAAFKASVYFARRACGLAASAGPIWEMLRHFADVTTRISELRSKTIFDVRAQKSILRFVSSVVEVVRKGTVVETEKVLDEVLTGVLEGWRKDQKGAKKRAFDESLTERASGIREIGRVFISVAKDALSKFNKQSKVMSM